MPQTWSFNDILQLLVIAVLVGLFWLQKAQKDTIAAARNTAGALAFGGLGWGVGRGARAWGQEAGRRSGACAWVGSSTAGARNDLAGACDLGTRARSSGTTRSLPFHTMPLPPPGLLFFELIFLSFRTMFTAIFTFPGEQRMMLKERASGMYRRVKGGVAPVGRGCRWKTVMPKGGLS